MYVCMCEKSKRERKNQSIQGLRSRPSRERCRERKYNITCAERYARAHTKSNDDDDDDADNLFLLRVTNEGCK